MGKQVVKLGLDYIKGKKLEVDFSHWTIPSVYADDNDLSKQKVNYLIKSGKLSSIFIKELNLRLVRRD